MNEIIKFFNQNKKGIIKIILIVAFLIVILRILNYLSKVEKENINNNFNSISEFNIRQNSTFVDNESAISGKVISDDIMNNIDGIIKKFIDYCNNNNIEEAYNMLSKQCKDELYPSIDEFERLYFNNLFKNQKRTYTLQNWCGDTYLVNYVGDVLGTGKNIDNITYQDYITISKEKDKEKLNINKYIGKIEIGKCVSNYDVNMEILYKNVYFDYEIYSINVNNLSFSDILLDTLSSTDSLYLMDSNDTKHNAITNELIKDNLVVYQGQSVNIKIKFNNPYISGRKISSINFSNFVLDYSRKNHGAYQTVKYKINL